MPPNYGVLITYKGALPSVAAKEMRLAQAESWEEAGEYHHRHHIPRHFTRAAYSLYGYQRRVGERMSGNTKGFHRTYTGRKLKSFGHTNPLVFTGESRELARQRDVRANSKGARVVMHMPSHFWKYRKDLNQPDKHAELRAVNEDEQRILTDVFSRALGRRLADVSTTRTTAPRMGTRLSA